jgi:hypothetical protein
MSESVLGDIDRTAAHENPYLREKEQEFLENLLGVTYPYSRPPRQWREEIDPEKIIALPDPHEPYGCQRVYDQLERQEMDAGTLIVTGDLGDYYSKSRFRKTRHQSFEEEVRSVFYRLEWLATRFRRVLVMMGNHDNRPEKTIADVIPVDLIVMTEGNLLKHLAGYFDNVEVVETKVIGGQPYNGKDVKIAMSHIYQHGDIIFSHIERSATQYTSLLAAISQQLHRWGGVIGLEPYRVIAQSHNHADLRMTMGQEKWFLMPAAAEPVSYGMEYIFNTRMIGSPPATGYAVFYQREGVTDYSRSHNILVERS